MAISENEYIKFIENSISWGKSFSCVILYESFENLAWYAALRIGEIITEYFKIKEDKEINIHLSLNIVSIMTHLNEMKDNDVLLLISDDQNIKFITAYLSREILVEKKNIIFISKDKNPLIQPFIGITRAVMKVGTLNKGVLECLFVVSNKDEKELRITQPDTGLIQKYHNLKTTLMEETIRKQVPELEDQNI
ncbi:hypothetical protein ES703_95626 [subsurface metagenome]